MRKQRPKGVKQQADHYLVKVGEISFQSRLFPVCYVASGRIDKEKTLRENNKKYESKRGEGCALLKARGSRKERRGLWNSCRGLGYGYFSHPWFHSSSTARNSPWVLLGEWTQYPPQQVIKRKGILYIFQHLPRKQMQVLENMQAHNETVKLYKFPGWRHNLSKAGQQQKKLEITAMTKILSKGLEL